MPMAHQKSIKSLFSVPLAVFVIAVFFSNYAGAGNKSWGTPGNFGTPGIIELPTAKRFPDGELIITHQNNKNHVF